ncbi:MAG: hypothetical protein KTR31_40115 [Myxococcales bacterium]|nr:hypothetical protein [Myxococcales bacterium]
MNPTTITTAAQYFEHAEGLSARQRRQAFEGLTGRERYLVLRGPRDDARFDPEHVVRRQEHTSPSGRYRLVITCHRPPEKGWSYSLGVVTRERDGAVLAEVRRNYGQFPFCWMEDHADGHDYLVCGEDYQGQTFCQLDTSEVFQHLPDATYDGHGFCWASYELLSDGRTLLVDGCYWAYDYELRLYDVSDPASGWPRIPWPEQVRDDDLEGTLLHGVWREEAGTLVWESPVPLYGQEQQPVQHRRVFRIEDGQVTLTEEWISEELLAERRQRAADEAAEEEQRRAWMQRPLYRALEAHAPTGRGATWFSYPSTKQREEGETNPVFIEVSARPYERDRNLTGTLRWGVDEGHVVATRSRQEPRSSEKRTFPRTAAGVRAAWDWLQEHLAGEPDDLTASRTS